MNRAVLGMFGLVSLLVAAAVIMYVFAKTQIPIAKAGDPSPFKCSATLTPEQMADVLAGRWYVNVHTPNHPPGEIRGQLVKK